MSQELWLALLREHWENARHIKNERIWFTNIYAIVVAASLSIVHTARGDGLVEVALLGFLAVLSGIGLLITLRLKAELEECLRKALGSPGRRASKSTSTRARWEAR